MTQSKDTKKSEVIVSQELNSTGRIFLLGVAVSLCFMFITTVSGIYWMCKDAPVDPVLECPDIVSSSPKKRKKFNFFGGNKKTSSVDDLKIEWMDPDPVHCACRLVTGFFRKQKTESELPKTCSPKQKEEVSSVVPKKELMEKYKVAFTREKLEVPPAHQKLIQSLDDRIHDAIPDWDERTSKVQWGGSTWNWYDPKRRSTLDASDLEQLHGGALYYSYLRIMKWPQSLTAHYPYKLCPNGCNSEESLRHTLEFREKYKPWMISPTVKKENSEGFAYTKGFSHSKVEGENACHSIVWIRPGLRTKTDDIAQIRGYVNTLERAVAVGLGKSNGRVGKFNVVLDGSGFSFGLMPSLHHVKVFVTMLQDHYPDRLGILLLTNLGRVGEVVVKMFLKLITEEVRNKIILLPHDPKERQEILNTVVGYENSPTWLGGTDTYQFNSNDYYADNELLFSDKEAKAYQESMPYHA
jgi:hypothetical protein